MPMKSDPPVVSITTTDREQIAGQVQEDRLTDAPPERTLTTDQIRADRQTDMHLTTDQIQQDRRQDEAPRTALELVRADKLTRSISLLESIRKLCVALLIVMVSVGGVFVIDRANGRAQISELEAEIAATQAAAEDIEVAFADFAEANTDIVFNHERTQRILCAWYRATGTELPANRDCDHR